jgi:hypothetical protein
MYLYVGEDTIQDQIIAFDLHFGQAWEKNITLRNRKGLQARRA